MKKITHSVILERARCKGCTNCIKRCPTEAIRIVKGKARIIEERCIDCGECIRHCPYHAKQARSDTLMLMDEFKYKIALPAPALYGQFSNVADMNYVLTALLEIGFDNVFEVASGAEVIARYSREFLHSDRVKKPIISSACPAVVKLIRIRFPHLCENVLPVISPMQAAARMARQEAMITKGLSEQDIGVFFISPCSAKITAAHQPIGIKQSWINGAFSMAEVYPLILEALGRIKEPKPLARSGIEGVRWANSGGEASALIPERYLAADGMENIMLVLEQLEDERLNELDFVELNCCPGGCVGGVLTVENPYVARARIQDMQRDMPPQDLEEIIKISGKNLDWQVPLTDAKVMRLSENRKEALTIMQRIDAVHELLPDLDCGSCGAPSCRTLAEDIVLGKASPDDCLFILKDKSEIFKVLEERD